MKQYRFDVIIIGAGPAGVSAAGALAGTGISVALLEAGVYAGAENWSGCVYFTENLAEEDCFGPAAVAAAPYERPVHRRGTLLHNGLDVVGVELTDPAVFKNCYTVLRPVYDPYFAHLARRKGAVHLTGTTVTSLIRKEGRVIGVETNRGPLYANVTFIAEGDASHLVRSEQLERVAAPHYLQGVKAVLSLKAEEIEQRFKLKPGEGAAYELLIRNAAIGGRTAKLNVGGFLYTNRDSLSIGYVAPLDNVRSNYRGDHDRLFEWMRGLPYIKALTEGAVLSSYGTKIIRSGGWRERPVLIEDGLAVGGSSAGLGIDLPFPNFTGPASATGLYFGRAVKSIMRRGSSCDAKNLTREYLLPLRASVYGANAEHLSAWPAYFGRSSVLFGRTVDVACGSAHFLSSKGLVETGRFLRSHILSYRGMKELVTDTLRAVSSLRLGRSFALSLVNPLTPGLWITNLLKFTPKPDPRLRVVLHINGRDVEATSLPWPLGSLVKRTSPALLSALEQVYANDRIALKKKLRQAVRIMLQSIKLTDLVVLPAFGLTLFVMAIGTAARDAFRFYVLKVPVEKLLAEPVMAYNESQKKARDLDSLRPALSLEAKLATNTYRVGAASHIRTFWPEKTTAQDDMAQAGLWWVCPARVYGYDAPPFAGRGRVRVNYENCIKCESCWRAEPARALWGRHTDHKLIYRPESAAFPILLDALGSSVVSAQHPADGRQAVPYFEGTLWYPGDGVLRAGQNVLNASAAFQAAVTGLPASADISRRSWPSALGKRLNEELKRLEAMFSNESRHAQAQTIQTEREVLTLRLNEGRFFHALYTAKRIDERIHAWGLAPDVPEAGKQNAPSITYEEASSLFPDRVVKQWEEGPLPAEWEDTVRQFIAGHREEPSDAVRALSSVSPALGLIAAHQLHAISILAQAEITLEPGSCAVRADHLAIQETIDSVRIQGSLTLVPIAACSTLLIIARGRGHLVPLSLPGVQVTQTPAIGFRAAALADIYLDCSIRKQAIMIADSEPAPDNRFYLAIALGVGDYLCRRVKEHALGRVQFPGQMQDTEGRDGIAKLGAVKALIARTEAWRLLLQTLYDLDTHSAFRIPNSAFDLLTSSLAALAFGPEAGTMGYDAGQVFGGFAYSEDDLLSRSYRDSSLYRFLSPGYGAAVRLNTAVGSADLENILPELGNLKAIQGEPLAGPAMRLRSLMKQCRALPADADTLLAGEAKAIVLSLRALLVASEQDLRNGKGNEAEAALIDVLLALAEEALARAGRSTGQGLVPPLAVFPVEPRGEQITLDLDYEAFCSAPGAPHRSGRFLTTAADTTPRFVPEMQLHDTKLRKRWLELANWFKTNCSTRDFEGLSIERVIEKYHRLPDEVLDAVKKNKWLATTVPQSEHGLGWHKAEYYILNSAAGSFGDASIDLLIMASTSIGTTPILLGLEDELPRVREELAPLAEDERKLGDIKERLRRIVQTLGSPNPAWIKKEYEAVMLLVDTRIRRTRVVKYLGANFLRAFYGAGIAGKRGDFGGFVANLKQAHEFFEKVMPDVHAALEELPRRERCHKLFLRYLGHGAVSAFALTEPTAGSDSGGVKTTAMLQSVKLQSLPDGRYSFVPTEGDAASIRYLIDADRIAFTGQGIAYQTPDNGIAEIRYDAYDYGTDQGVRYYVYQGKRCEFHDIGQVRRSEQGEVYEFYLLTGAKMWITNGSIATQFCLYAQTPEGVTGFMVDRHSEGLKVGADEKKTGQRGSPTNEISIDNARVPREAVIGYEGHGQVNALETLNVGRCGLAVVSGALMRKLMQEAVLAVPASAERDRLLGEAAAVLFGSESLAYYLVGLFDRPHESVRMESAIAKFVCSEDIHELLTLVERAFGPVGQTEKHLLEKARRDSRILTIYEGTNEVQRFLIVKDLIALASDWPELSVQQEDEGARMLLSWKNKLRARVKEAAQLLGDAAWADAMLQPALFPLAEMAGEILKLECIRYRIAWLIEHTAALAQASPDYAPSMLKAGTRAAELALSRLSELDRKYAAAWELVKENLDMPEVRAADAVLDRLSEKASTAFSLGSVQARLRILAIVRPVADLAPAPRIADGVLREIVWQPEPCDLSGLQQVLKLKEQSGSAVIVDVLMPGGPEQEEILRTTAGARANTLHRLPLDPAAVPQSIIKTVKDLEALYPYDLIIIGAECLDGDRSLGAYLAGNLKRVHYRREHIIAKPDNTGLEHIALPAVVSITHAALQDEMPMEQAIESAFAKIRVMEPAKLVSSQARFELPEAKQAETGTISDIAGAAKYLKLYAASASASLAQAFAGDVQAGTLPGGDAVWAFLDPQQPRSNVAVLRAASHAARLMNREAHAVLCSPRDSWPQLLGLAKANGCGKAFCVDTQKGRLSNEGKRTVVRSVLKTAARAVILAGSEWVSTFGYEAGESETAEKRFLLCSGVTEIMQRNGGLVLSAPAYTNKLIRKYLFEKGSLLATIAAEGEFPAPVLPAAFFATMLDLAIASDWIMPLPPVAAPTLVEADVIIDLGYGIRNEAGMKLALELKETLEKMGLAPLFGATRKVTQDLKLLPLEAQIGQTGVRVNPKLVIALGISGAPQHIDYIGTRADILCLNKDREAPLMNLNQTRPAPRVHPIAGDLFVTVRQIIEELKKNG
jgi:alkylation response protein AidB-like acyl-CoA dehydrogenase/flavin-dependent dehydrogenase/electron transfer flavoprotein alpha subunit/ferredoxin-like protein FixX